MRGEGGVGRGGVMAQSAGCRGWEVRFGVRDSGGGWRGDVNARSVGCRVKVAGCMA